MPQRSTEQRPAVASYFDHQRGRLVRIAERILGDRDEVEDVVQDTALAVWQRLEIEPIWRVDRYAARAVRINAVKRQARRRQHLPTNDGADRLAAPTETSTDADEIDPMELERALLDLPATQQAVIRMKYYAGLTFGQIGQVLAISSNTASSRCRYGLQELRSLLHRSE